MSMGLREEKKARLRQEIVDAATDLFRERGFDGTRVQDIVDRVRCSEATFFNYFPTKDSLLEEYALERFVLYEALLQHEVISPERTVAERTREIIEQLGTSFAGDRELSAILVTRSTLMSGSSGEMARHQMHAFDLLAELFAQGQRSGEIRQDIDPLLLADIFTQAWSGVLMNWLVDWWPNAGPLAPRLAAAADVFLEGAGRERPPRRARKR